MKYWLLLILGLMVALPGGEARAQSACSGDVWDCADYDMQLPDKVKAWHTKSWAFYCPPERPLLDNYINESGKGVITQSNYFNTNKSQLEVAFINANVSAQIGRVKMACGTATLQCANNVANAQVPNGCNQITHRHICRGSEENQSCWDDYVYACNNNTYYCSNAFGFYCNECQGEPGSTMRAAEQMPRRSLSQRPRLVERGEQPITPQEFEALQRKLNATRRCKLEDRETRTCIDWW